MFEQHLMAVTDYEKSNMTINKNKIFNQIMRMKNRICGLGKALLGTAALLSTVVVTYSCSDDFDLDKKGPSFLGASIYDDLKSSGRFNTVIRLIDEVDDTKDILSKTGSMTIFVADDAAYQKFFETCPWTDASGQPVRAYEQLSKSQKRLLLNGSMLNNAYVMEMLTTVQGGMKNLCLRQLSAVSATDSVPYFNWQDLPDNGQTEGEFIFGKVKNPWARYRTQAYGGMYLALDKTQPMMTHFLEGQLREKNIKGSDISFILNLDGTPEEWNDDSQRSYIYNARVTEADKTCLNGYYHVVDKVLVTPQNMAEVIRTNGNTKLFSLLLDRFSAPYYDKQLTDDYKALHTIAADSVFQKLYISQRSQIGNITNAPDGSSLGNFPSLSYDPGWNAYTVSGSTKEQDMAAMFVPNDETLASYFLHGGGEMFINIYGTKENTRENLEYNLYQLPLDIVKPMIANLMKESFNETVPSKYLTIMNDAQDPMFPAAAYPNQDAYKADIEKVLLANNGVVYVMKSLISPAAYASVMAPAFYNEDAQVMSTIIHADDANTNTDYANAPLRRFYSTYLLAMQSNFSFFVPNDEGLYEHGLVDPMAYSAGRPTNYLFWNFKKEPITKKDGKNIAINAQSYRFSMDKPMQQAPGIVASYYSTANDNMASKAKKENYGATKAQLLTDMVDQHIIVHEVSNEGELGVNSGRRYYLSRNGAPVYIKHKAGSSLNVGDEVNGGFQLMVNNDEFPNNDFDCKVTKIFDLTRATNAYGNGMTYFLDRPMQATLNNTYKILSSTPEFSRFFELCSALDTKGKLMEQLFKESDEEWVYEKEKYTIFATESQRPTLQGTRLVRFFNNYRYTVYVPTNEAIDEAFTHYGLKSLDEIATMVENATSTDEEGQEVIDPEVKEQAKAMVVCYVNFLKHHFADESFFVDNCSSTHTSSSACANTSNNYITIDVKQTPEAITIVDGANREVHVQAPFNLMARDYELDNTDRTLARDIKSSSYVALHSIDSFMWFTPEVNGNFAKAWATPQKAKAFVKKYGFKK